jgi:hypothetical protein
VHPRSPRRSERRRLLDRVERARVHVAGLQANDDRASILDARQPRLQRLGLQAALPVDVDQLGRAEARVAKGDVDRLATFDAAEHADPGRPRQAPPIEVPPAALQHGRPRCSQAGEGGHHPASHAGRSPPRAEPPGRAGGRRASPRSHRQMPQARPATVSTLRTRSRIGAGVTTSDAWRSSSPA